MGVHLMLTPIGWNYGQNNKLIFWTILTIYMEELISIYEK